jgi:hypothetical protein
MKRNIDFLSNMPYVDVGNGLAMTADINMPGDMHGEWRIAVNHGVMEQLGVDRNELFINAMESAVSYDRATLTDMTQALFSPDKENLLDRTEPLEPMEVGGMYVLTTESGNLGASALFYPDVKEKAAEMIGSGYYVLPSSIHECIIVPDTGNINAEDLGAMVKDVNSTQVAPDEVLSDNVYFYDREEKNLCIATTKEPLVLECVSKDSEKSVQKNAEKSADRNVHKTSEKKTADKASREAEEPKSIKDRLAEGKEKSAMSLENHTDKHPQERGI